MRFNESEQSQIDVYDVTRRNNVTMDNLPTRRRNQNIPRLKN